ncbi:MAG TPA: GGDEF domain-containing protein [Pseudonocardiaceae bacterium]|nr:GGDEF domain-containing protein [Pseudonocardiaceae bacterium]
MPALLDDVHFAFQPLFNLQTGAVTAVEALARPSNGGVRELLREAADTGQLTPTDYGLAASAILRAAEHGVLVPLHVNLLAQSVCRAHVALEPIASAMRATGRRPGELTIELSPPFGSVRRAAFEHGLTMLHEIGFRLAVDGVGEGDPPLTLMADPAVEMLKVDRAITAQIATDPRRKATLRALLFLCEENDIQLVAEGVESPDQLAALHKLGVRAAQGNLLHPPSRRPAAHLAIPPMAADPGAATGPVAQPGPTAGPKVTELMHPPTALPADATAEQVRTALASQDSVNCVVLLDENERPLWTIDRNRFLLAVTGPYGHALHANRDAARLADKPRVVPIGSSALSLLEMLTNTERERTNDDLVVIDAAHRCVGVVRVADLIRAVADSKIEQAAALNPLTRLPGSDSIAREVDRRIAARDMFAVSWLDVDTFKSINDGFGFAAGDELIRRIGQTLAVAKEKLPNVHVGHIGGDDFLFVTGLDELMTVGGHLVDQAWSVEDRPITLSLATMVCMDHTARDFATVSRLLAPLKQQAKSISGASWVVGRPGHDRVDVLRRGKSRLVVPQARNRIEVHSPVVSGAGHD